jgi:hypothetical protein
VIRRTLRLTAVAALAAAALAGCQTYQGTAAYVGDTRITTDTVDDQVDEFYSDEFWAKQTEGQRAAVTSRTVNGLVLQELVKQVARDIDVDEEPLPGQIDEALAAFKEDPRQIPSGLLGAPLRVAATVSVYAQAIQMQLAKEDPKATQDAAFKAIQKTATDSKVTVNPRYGTFDPTALAMKEPKDPAGVLDLPVEPLPGEEPQPDQQQPPQEQQPDQPPSN